MSAAIERQTFCLALAFALSTLWPTLSWLSLLVSYALSTLFSGLLLQRTWLGSATPKQRAATLLLLAVPTFAALWRRVPELEVPASVESLIERTRARLEVETLPNFAPRLVSLDRPQTYYVHAAASAKVSLSLSAGLPFLEARPVGEGVYRVQYDPHRDGLPAEPHRPHVARLRVNGAEVERDVMVVKPYAHPRFFCVSPDGSLAAAVSEETDELLWLSAEGLIARQATGDGPTDCVFSSDVRVLVSHRFDAELWELERGRELPVRKLRLGEAQRRLAVSRDRSRVAVARHGVTPEVVILTLPDLTVTTRVALDLEPDQVSFGPEPSTLLVATRRQASLRKLQVAAGRYVETARLSLCRPVVFMEPTRDHSQLWIAVTDFCKDGKASLGNHYVQDQLLSIDVASFSPQDSLLTARRSPRQDKPGDVDQGVSPMGLAFAAAGSRFVSFAGTSELWQLDAAGRVDAQVDLTKHGLVAPHGVAVLADGSVLVSSPARGLIAVFDPNLQKPKLVRLAPTDSMLEKQDPDGLARRLGEWGFYESTRSGISCQSCHLHADSDEALHNLGGRRLLPTLSTLGLLGTGPFLRDGSFTHVSDLDHVSQTLYRGYLRKGLARKHTLDAFVSALPRNDDRARTRPLDRDAEARGITAFTKARCTLCHAPPYFSGFGQHPASALFPELADALKEELLDAPALLSTAAQPPYLHDGRAGTLDELLTRHNRNNRHGDTKALSSAERKDLLHFLESL